MKYITPAWKDKLAKVFTIVSFLITLIFIGWLSVQIVNIFPSAINSLASLAESVYTYNPKHPKTITFKPVKEPVTVNEKLTVAWETQPEFGTYSFSYECQNGIAIDLKNSQNVFKSIECGHFYNLGLVDNAEIIIDSEKETETKVTYTISYFKTNSPIATVKESQSVTVTNPKLSIENNEVPSNNLNGEVPTANTQVSTTTTTYKYTYTIPTSNPTGFTDLKLTYLGIGEIDKAGNFVNTGVLNKNKPGAIQFSVHNIGTKTSDEWNFSAVLPGAITYDSDKQIALKPNERTVLTISFPAVTTTKLQTFSFNTKTKRDNNTNNNSIHWSSVVIE